MGMNMQKQARILGWVVSSIPAGSFLLITCLLREFSKSLQFRLFHYPIYKLITRICKAQREAIFCMIVSFAIFANKAAITCFISELSLFPVPLVIPVLNSFAPLKETE